MSIFKSGSIRGLWNEEWDGEIAYRIGFHLCDLLSLKRVAVGQDGRESSPEIAYHLVRGLVRGGAQVDILGCIDTPAVMFANIAGGYEGSVMITASHNPPEYNGLKICGGQAEVIGRANGLAQLEDLVKSGVGPLVPGGESRPADITEAYLSFLDPYIKECGPLRVVVDCSHGTAAVLIQRIIEGLPGEFILLNDAVDGLFPGHGPDPTDERNLALLKKAVVREKADLGICFDGDGDRMIVVDEKGQWVSPDIILTILSRYYFLHFPEKRRGDRGILYDARSSNSVKEVVEELGGKAYRCATGHRAMQAGLPAHGGLMGGELPGHYYYRDFWFLDNGWIPFLQLQTVLSRENEPLSRLAARDRRYHFSGELNFRVPPVLSSQESLRELIIHQYHDGDATYQDGIRIDYPSWWFLVRMANTEPVLRLVAEARTQPLLEEKVKEVSDLLYRSGAFDHQA